MKNIDRKTHEIELDKLELDDCLKIIASQPIEGLILICTRERRYDIGALCFLKRMKISRGVQKTVSKSSLRSERCRALRTWLTEKISEVYYGTISNQTLYTHITEINALFEWCDKNSHMDFLISAFNYKIATAEFTQYLLQKIKNGHIGNHNGSRIQYQVLDSGNLFFPNSPINFRDDLPIIPNKGGKNKPVSPPTKAEMEHHLVPCQYLFDGLTDFLLNNHPFPYHMPFLSENIWLLPAEYPLASQKILETNIKIKRYICWDYQNGRIRSLSEAKAISGRREHDLIKEINNAHLLVQESNDNYRHPKRMRLAKLAHDAFLSLFVANTGLNEKQIRDLPWNGTYKVDDSDEQGFNVIKARAGNREISVSIKKTFLRHFEKFIKLREYICERIDHQLLFVGLSSTKTNYLNALRTGEIHSFIDQIKRFLDPTFKGINYQKLRKYKSNYLLSKGHPIKVVSALMQTSEITIIKNYAEADEKTAIDEITAMMNRLISLLDDFKGEDIPSGGCAGTDQRSTSIPIPNGYEPDCNHFECCIFCDQFRVHANKETLQKLFSMRYVTLEYLGACTDSDQFQRVHEATVKQIDRILSELVTARPDLNYLVEIVMDEVQNHFKLTPYWERLYERLVTTGVIN